MGIIDQQGELVGDFDHLNTAFHLCLQQCLFNIFLFHLEMAADGNGCQRVVHAEFAGHGYLHVKIHQSGYMEGDAQFSGLMHQFPVLGPEHAVLSHSKTLQSTGVTFRHRLPMLIVTVNNAYLTLPEQQSLTVQIFLEAGMLVGPDMIRLQIRENTVIKHKALSAVQHQCLRRHLHDYGVQSRLHHAGKILLQQIGFRCGIVGMDMFVPDDHFDGSHQTYFVAGIFQNGLYQIGRGGLALGACDTDDFQFLRRMAEPGCGNKCHGIAGIRHFDHRHIRIFGKFHISLYYQHSGALCGHLCGKIMSVKICSVNTNEQASRNDFTGVIDHSRDLPLQASAYLFIFQFIQKFC